MSSQSRRDWTILQRRCARALATPRSTSRDPDAIWPNNPWCVCTARVQCRGVFLGVGLELRVVEVSEHEKIRSLGASYIRRLCFILCLGYQALICCCMPQAVIRSNIYCDLQIHLAFIVYGVDSVIGILDHTRAGILVYVSA